LRLAERGLKQEAVGRGIGQGCEFVLQLGNFCRDGRFLVGRPVKFLDRVEIGRLDAQLRNRADLRPEFPLQVHIHLADQGFGLNPDNFPCRINDLRGLRKDLARIARGRGVGYVVRDRRQLLLGDAQARKGGIQGCE
jgi:hypothetical protein